MNCQGQDVLKGGGLLKVSVGQVQERARVSSYDQGSWPGEQGFQQAHWLDSGLEYIHLTKDRSGHLFNDAINAT